MEGEVASAREVHCTEEKVPLETTPPEESETNPKPSETLAFTRRNPKRSTRDVESDLNIDRLTRIRNPGTKSRREKEIFDPALLVSLIRDPNLTTRKRKPLNRRVGDSVWGEIKNLSHILDLQLEYYKLKQEKKNQVALGKKKMDGNNKISNQFVMDARHLKQEEMLERDLYGALNVQRATKGRETAGPGSSPDSVVYNPVSCEAKPVVPQHKQSTKSKKKKEKEGENANPSKRDGLLNASASANQGGLYYLQVDAMGRPIFNGIMDEKAQDLSAPGVVRMDTDNMPETNNVVPIASLSGSFSSNVTREPFKYESFLAQLLLPVRLFVPLPPGSIPVPMQSVTSHSILMPGQLVTVPGLLRQPFPVHMHPSALSLGPLHMPENSAAEEGKPMQAKEQPVLVPLQLDHALAQSIPNPAKPAPPKTRVAWVCCDECGKWRCIPAELADAIDETNCRWTCKDNDAKEFADCSIPQEKSNAEINAELEISDASGDEGPSGRGNELGDINYMKPSVDMRPHLTKSVKNALGPAPYTPLKMNLFLHRNRKTQTIDEIMVCNCKPPENGGLGCRSQCLNRMLSIECIEGMCPCVDFCSNQQFQRRNYAKLMYFRCGKKGYGLQLLEDVTAGRFLIEYVGEVLDMPTYEARQKEYATIGQKHFFFMTLNGGEVIDACAKGNLGRFINHSCDPNCRTEKWIVNGEVCIGLFAIRDIKKGEELTFDYNYVRVVGAAAKKCFCGSANCKGYIGGDPSSSELVVQEDSDEEDLFEPVHRGAAIVTLSDNFLNKHPVSNKSQDMFGSFAPVLQKDNSVEMHKSSNRERLMGCKPDSAVSLLANSLVNGTMDEALALPANSQQAFGLLPGDNSQSVIHPENSLRVSKSKNRENLMRHNTDTVLIKQSDSQGVSNGGGLSQSISSADSSLEICKTEYRGDISQCKPDSILSLPANSHEVNELLDKEADKNRDMKDVSLPSSPSSIAVPSYSLLQLHLPKVNSLVELKMGDGDGLLNNTVNGYKPLKKESLLQGLSEKAVPLYNSLEECELMDGEKLFQAPPEDCIHDKIPYEFCTENRDVDDVSTPALPDQSVEQDPVGTDIDNLCTSPCTPVSPSNGFAPSSSVVPEHLSSPNEDIPSEEDVPSTPVHVTRYLSNRVHSRRSAGMEADKMSSKPGLCTKPSDFFDVQLEQVDLGVKKVNQHDRSSSPPVDTCGMKTVHADAEDEGLAMCQEVKEIVHNTASLNFEEVEEKLNEFLDQDGCISRHRNATKGYLKLLIVTAAAGDTGTSQRLRDMSLILDALLKTKSYNVLMDLMKKNGLQMLHTILKQNRDNFNWIPIIRKLLRVFGHLGNMGVLTLEQMNQGPPRPGMESFRESIYKLTKHKNNMVHQIAHEFFNRWMPKSMRVYDSFSHTSNSSAPFKRKILWDHPSDSHSQNPKLALYNSQDQQVERPAKRPHSESLEEDAPPGFEPIGPPLGFGSALPPDIESVSPPGFGSAVQPALVSVSDVSPVQVALGFRQEKYRPGISVSYGIPAAAAQNLGGFVESEGRVSWGIAPSTPFHPFPPLPPYHTIGNRNGENNRPGFRSDRERRRWGSNLRNQRRFSKSWNNNDDARDRSNHKRSGKYRPKWPRDRDRR